LSAGLESAKCYTLVMDIEKAMQFIIEHQARHGAAIQQLDERLVRLGGLVETNTGMIRQLVDVSLSLANTVQQLGEETDRRIRELTESQAHSDRRLDALINVVDKLARRNGDKLQ